MHNVCVWKSGAFALMKNVKLIADVKTVTRRRALFAGSQKGPRRLVSFLASCSYFFFQDSALTMKTALAASASGQRRKQKSERVMDGGVLETRAQ